MRTREKSLSDYGIPRQDQVQLVQMCKNLDEIDMKILKEAATSAAPGLEKYVLRSITTPNLGYRRMGDVPIKEDDFYAYRRKTLAIFYDRLRLFGRWGKCGEK